MKLFVGGFRYVIFNFSLSYSVNLKVAKVLMKIYVPTSIALPLSLIFLLPLPNHKFCFLEKDSYKAQPFHVNIICELNNMRTAGRMDGQTTDILWEIVV